MSETYEEAVWASEGRRLQEQQVELLTEIRDLLKRQAYPVQIEVETASSELLTELLAAADAQTQALRDLNAGTGSEGV